MNAIKAKRGRAKGCLTRALTFSESVDDSTSLPMLEIQFKRLNQSWADFVSLQDRLYEFYEHEDFVDPEPEFGEYETKYFQSHAVLVREIRKRSNDQNAKSVEDKLANQQSLFLKRLEASTSSKSIVLPKLVVPVFSGDYKDWPAFKDLFTGTIDSNPSITATQKFQYLKSFLSGEAASLIKHIPCSEDNYIEAWDKLEARYDKKQLIIQSFIQSFLSLPSLSSSNLHNLRKLTDGADEVIRGLNALDSNTRDPWLIYILLQRLDNDTKQAWAQKIGTRDDGTIDQFLEFLQIRCSCLESCYSLNRSSSKPTSKVQNSFHSHIVETKIGCPKCKEDHMLPYCKAFIALGVSARRDFVKEKSLCFNCLRPGHASTKCRSNFRCRTCNSRHHSLVHATQNTTLSTTNVNSIDTQPSHNSPPSSSHNTDTTPINNLHSLESTHRLSTILPTAVVRTRDKQGIFRNLRVLLDTGSQVSFITEQAVQHLGLSRKRSRIPITGVASTSAGITNGLTTLTLHSRFNLNTIDLDCYVISKITSLLPPFSLSKAKPNILSSMDLADPNFNEPAPIDILIGADKAFSVIQGSSKSESGGPDSIPTIFGWVIAGSCQQLSPTKTSAGVGTFCTQLDYTQEFDLERFWRLEEVHTDPPLSVEEQLAEEHFVKTHYRTSNGRYMVQLPFKPNTRFSFENSFRIALNRLHSIERRFLSDPELKLQYSRFINEYLSLGHMEEIPLNEINQPTTQSCYLPHHAVFKSDSSTTKVRVVFDGSAKSNIHSESLNETLFVGPTIQRDLFSICLRCRRHTYTISGDIEKMYRQILVSPNHTDFQRIVWRETQQSALKHYRLLTVTYGTSAAPFLAVRTLKQLALDSAQTYPRASAIILNDFYVDDVITGADSIEEITTLRNELVELLKSAGFNLRKWTTNCWPLLISLPEEQRELSPIEFEESMTIKLLGLQWCPSKDCFLYKVNLSKTPIFTKRRILSEASRIFDPLGFLAPVIIAIKIFFQDLWREKLNWDEEITQELAHRWTSIRDELHVIETIIIPRVMWTNKFNWELHAFCDASLDAYAAVVYCRSINKDGTISVSIVAAKSRVAPIKVLSLPRLELCGALLLTRLIDKIKLSLQNKEIKVFAWTDSSIVLHWLSSTPKKWSVFIGNRTSEILSSVPYKSWNHVRSAFNPADVASRGILPSLLASSKIWWNGPSWLSKDSSEWPLSQYSMQDITVDHLEERKLTKVQVFVSTLKNTNTNVLETIIIKSSNWMKSVRVVAYILRFTKNIRSRNNRIFQTLSTKEIADAKSQLIKCAQCSLFALEIKALKNGKELPSRNKIISLAPFLDHINVLRVGGRLQQSDLSFDEKHPIILCKSHPIAKLIAQYIHKHFLHAGVSLMISLMKQNFHVIGCRNLLRKIVHDCVICFRQRQTSSSQLMGNLPVERVRFSRPFSKVGCDYAGPIMLRLARGRNPRFVKAYIALFVCFVTKGVHIELVGDLSTNAFLLALDRFVSRRGKPSEIWSDNATNFHGAKRLLGEMYDLLRSQQHQNIVQNHLSKDNIVWKFIPPSAPHFGGLWEAGVKSIKLHLKRVIGENILTYEEMYTLLAKIECLLNSRPMWQTPDFEPTALTPSHFMIGESYCAVPTPDLSNTHYSTQTNWYLLQSLLQGFWKRWHREYLTSLQNRPKWQQLQRNLQKDDVVLLKESNLPPSKWILGRIVDIHPGKDNRCRVVTVHTKFGDYVRPIVKIAPLPISERP